MYIDTDKTEKPDTESEGERLKRFFFGEKRKFNSTLEELYFNEGRCPQCGELGRIHLSVMICSVHGPY